MEEYSRCKICDGALPESLAALSRRRFERMVCGAQCQRAEDIRYGRLCCDKAEYINCVCAYATSCPEHGDKHVGTHD
jgi:hypothetical protein